MLIRQPQAVRSNREHTVRRLFTWCVWIFFVLAGSLHADLVDRVIAVVNNDVILLSDLNQTLETISIGLDKQGYSESQKEQILKDQRPRILEQLIYDKLTDQQIQRLKIKIDESDVDATIQRIERVNKISSETLRSNLERSGISYDDYREQVKEKLLRTRLVNREVKSKIVITDEDIKTYYESHLHEYGGYTKYELRHILVKVPPTADATEKEHARQKIEKVYTQLKNGGAFADLAAEYSEAASASNDGFLGVFDLSILSEQVRQVLKGLKANQYSRIVDTDQGYQIFYIESIIRSGGKGIDEVRAEIQDKLYAQIVDKKFNDWIKELRKRSDIQIIEP